MFVEVKLNAQTFKFIFKVMSFLRVCGKLVAAGTLTPKYRLFFILDYNDVNKSIRPQSCD